MARNRRRISNSARFRVLLPRRQLLADDAPVELGTRAFDVLMVLLEADGALVRKEELISRVWPSIVVSEENLKFQVHALRKALGADPYGIWPRLSVHRRAAHEYRIGALPANAVKAAVWPKSFSYRVVGIRSNAVSIRSRALTGKGFAVSTQ
jgi:hypothetical protein